MLLRNLTSTDSSSLLSEMSDGLPTIAAFARLCGRAIAGEMPGAEPSREAMAIVAASAGKGIFELRGNKDAFETADRFLAVCVEIAPDQRLLFRDKANPRQTMLFLDGFRQLCQSGFIVHHLLKDFSLSKAGYELADTLNAEEYQELIDFAVTIEY